MSVPTDRVISVLVADDDEDQRFLVEQILLQAGWAPHDVTSVPDGRQALRALREGVFDVALLDLSMPGLDGLEVIEAMGEDPRRPQVIFVSGQGTVATATRAMKLGAYDFVEKPVDPERLVALVWKAAQTQSAIAQSERFKEVVSRQSGQVRIVTQDPGMEAALEMLARVAGSDASVLVHGESGTGKELAAREVHRLSQRAGEPLVALNCAAVAESLAESELFGHEKGAFTGAAAKRVGLIELSDGGTLFLDEIGDLSLQLQAKLLRVLETKLFRRVGGTKEFPANFRLVSATNRPLTKMVEEESFRGDLLYRINAIVVELPPLRERRGDIRLLATHFLHDMRPHDADEWSFDDEAVTLLESYAWPGNVRELRNVIERAALLARGRRIRAADLSGLATPRAARSEKPLGRDGASAENGLPALDLSTLERMAIEQALERTRWHQGQASELLGVSPRTLHRKIREYGLERPR